MQNDPIIQETKDYLLKVAGGEETLGFMIDIMSNYFRRARLKKIKPTFASDDVATVLQLNDQWLYISDRKGCTQLYHYPTEQEIRITDWSAHQITKKILAYRWLSKDSLLLAFDHWMQQDWQIDISQKESSQFKVKLTKIDKVVINDDFETPQGVIQGYLKSVRDADKLRLEKIVELIQENNKYFKIYNINCYHMPDEDTTIIGSDGTVYIHQMPQTFNIDL